MCSIEQCDESVIDITINMLEETIAIQSLRIGDLEKSLHSMKRQNTIELEKVVQGNAKQIQTIFESNEALNLKLQKQTRDRENLSKDFSRLKSLLEEIKHRNNFLERVSEEQRQLFQKNQDEVLKNEEVVKCQVSKEIQELQQTLDSVRRHSANLAAENSDLKSQLNEKFFELEHANSEFDEINKFFENVQIFSAKHDQDLINKMFQIREKVEKTCDVVVKYEEENNELKMEIENFQRIIVELKKEKEELNSQFTHKVSQLLEQNSHLETALNEKIGMLNDLKIQRKKDAEMIYKLEAEQKSTKADIEEMKKCKEMEDFRSKLLAKNSEYEKILKQLKHEMEEIIQFH